MKPFTAILRASMAALTATALLAAPVAAAPISMVGPAVASHVRQIQYRPPHRLNRHVERRGDRYYYGGHRLYREHRPGYRYYDGWWVPPALFGLFLGGAIATQPHALSRAHVRWCYEHYRSYREWDNTYQPYHGPRRQCVSPYY